MRFCQQEANRGCEQSLRQEVCWSRGVAGGLRSTLAGQAPALKVCLFFNRSS